MTTIKDLREARIEKLNKLKELGQNPYKPQAHRSALNSEITSNFMDYAESSVSVVGRLTSLRAHGSVVFADMQDESGTIQLLLLKDHLKETSSSDQTIGFTDLNLLNVGDFVQVSGIVTKTKTEEISIRVDTLSIVSKSIRPLPDDRTGLKNVEERYRKRYLDLLINPESKKILDARWKIEQEIRKFMWSKSFKEVETPILQSLYGGTNAKPFTTHFNALDCDFYLRVAPELYLKRLIVGGYEKVFEIARNFRNEGIDQTHFPEFTMLEWYEAYADYHRVMDLAEELTKHLVKELTGGTKITVNGKEIEVGGTWPRIAVEDLMKEKLDIEWNEISDEKIHKLLADHKINVPGVWDRNKALFSIYDHLLTSDLVDPVWVIDYPSSVSPLSKSHRSKAGRVERFEGYIGGVEIFDGWSEIVSGLEQLERFENEQKNMKAGDDEAMPLDIDFIEALEYGCPPLGGIGFGIDRLTMFLTDVWSIKQVVAFPILKPEEKPAEENPLPSAQIQISDDISGLPSHNEAVAMLEEHVTDKYQLLHARMVAEGLKAYARKFGENEDLWWITGLIHDVDYFEFPDEHPHRSLEWFAEKGYPEQLQHAVSAHAWKWTNVQPQTKLAAALIAIDELAGFLYAYSLMRPEGWNGMGVSSIKKKFKDKSFAAKIDREEIQFGITKLGVDFDEHVQFLIDVYQNMDELK